MKSIVSVRGQTVIPKEIRDALDIKPHSELMWMIRNGTIVVYPLPSDPVKALKGALKNVGPTEELLAERQADRGKEEAQIEELIGRWRSTS